MKRLFAAALLAGICLSMTACMDWAVRKPTPPAVIATTAPAVMPESSEPAAVVPDTAATEATEFRFQPETVSHEVDATPKAGISDIVAVLPYVSGASLTGLAALTLTKGKKEK